MHMQEDTNKQREANTNMPTRVLPTYEGEFSYTFRLERLQCSVPEDT